MNRKCSICYSSRVVDLLIFGLLGQFNELMLNSALDISSKDGLSDHDVVEVEDLTLFCATEGFLIFFLV
jgi:hypothetical protein